MTLARTSTEQRFWLPTPISVNEMFRTAGFGQDTKRSGRIKTEAYARWGREAAFELMRQKAKRYDEPVVLSMFFGQRSPLADVSNYIKGVEDALVSYGIIPDDNAKTVKGFDKVCWVPNFLGCVVHIKPYVESDMLWEDFDKGVLGTKTATAPGKMGVHPSALGRVNRKKRKADTDADWVAKAKTAILKDL